jgi:hypothetical protein
MTSGLAAPQAYEPPAVEKWFREVGPDVKLFHFDAFRDPDTRFMENVRVVVGYDTPKKVKPTPEFTAWLQDVMGKARWDAHFEVPALLDVLARGLGTAGFHTIIKLVVDDNTIFESKKGKEIKAACLLVTEDAHRRTKCAAATVTAMADELSEDCKAILTVRSSVKKPIEVEVTFEGEVTEEETLKLLGFIREQLPKRVE